VRSVSWCRQVPHTLGVGALCLAVAVALAVTTPASAADKTPESRMSPAGQRAARALEQMQAGPAPRALAAPLGVAAPNECGEELECQEKTTRQPGGQAEVSIAVDWNGQNIVVGYNDSRGFFTNPYQLSGYIVSHDGGKTFSSDGLLPTDGLTYVYGDPDVKYLGGCDFVYSSIGLVVTTGPAGDVYAQSMVVHRSRDCGDTWEGPFEVASATNPNGNFDGPYPIDAADKEFMDVDPDTGRVIMSWSNFTDQAPGGVEIRSTYSDDIMAGSPPTWSPGVVVAATAFDGQSSIPRFAGHGSPRVYMAWRRYSTTNYFVRATGFAYSDDNGETWSTPANLAAFYEMDQVLGNDRINTSPSLAVGRHGEVYVVYAHNTSLDGADVAFQKSTDGGQTFTPPVLVNASPGADRAQWFPWVATDDRTGRVYVYYYDQGIAESGDLSEVSVTWSDDEGDTWSPPVPLTKRPFKAGWGNNTGQPNLGDYNQAVAQGRTLFAAYGLTERPKDGFVGSQPNGYFEVPNIDFERKRARELERILPVSLGPVEADESWHPRPRHGKGWHGWSGYHHSCRRHRDHLLVKLPVENYTTNPLSSEKLRWVWGILTEKTPGVEVEGNPFAWFGNLHPGKSAEATFVLGIDSDRFKEGDPIELALKVYGLWDRETTLEYTLFTDSDDTTTLLAEDFEIVDPASGLPPAWESRHGAGDTVVPWTASATFCDTGSQGVFHANAEDGGGLSPARWERLYSPSFDVPVNSDYVTVEFDVCTNTEDNLPYPVWAWDGFFLRVTDLTPGRVVISNLVEAFADEFTTGDREHYPKHLPRNSDPAYFEDMSAWAGYSGGVQHVRMRLPGMEGSTAQLRFEFTQDSNSICADPSLTGGECGVFVDNVVVKSHRAETSHRVEKRHRDEKSHRDH
jgi:BNR/Asp-box repeat